MANEEILNEEQNQASNEIQNTEENASNEATASEAKAPEEVTNDEAKPAADAPVEGEQESKKADAQEQQTEKSNNFDEVFAKLKTIFESNETVEVQVLSRIRGGLRVTYENMQLFLPASHYSLKRNPSEEELLAAVGQTFKVSIHELNEDEQGRKTVIVTRKDILENDFWSKIKVGDVCEGVVSSIANFGVFVDIGGVEGLIHISRLSQVHVNDPKEILKKGDTIKAVIVEADREKNRIALSRKELEESPWKNVPTEFPVASQHKGIVRRITDFGAYVELKPGVDGLLRTAELSWTRRIKKPDEILAIDQEINVEIIALNEEKQTITLSYKRTLENPWASISEKYPVESEAKGVISQVVPQGCIITIENEIDGFMPRSKYRALAQAKKLNYEVGDEIEVVIADLVPDDESLILAPKVNEEDQALIEKANKRPERKDRPRQQNSNVKLPKAEEGFTLGDLLSEEMKKNLLK